MVGCIRDGAIQGNCGIGKAAANGTFGSDMPKRRRKVLGSCVQEDVQSVGLTKGAADGTFRSCTPRSRSTSARWILIDTHWDISEVHPRKPEVQRLVNLMFVEHARSAGNTTDSRLLNRGRSIGSVHVDTCSSVVQGGTDSGYMKGP